VMSLGLRAPVSTNQMLRIEARSQWVSNTLQLRRHVG
jgi:hypothetical protein